MEETTLGVLLITAATIGVEIAPVAGAGEVNLEVPTIGGRVYRMGLGGATVTQAPREDNVAYQDFTVKAQREGDIIVLMAHIPAPAIREEVPLK